MKRFTLSILVLFFSSVVLCQIILPTEVTASKPEVLKPKHGVVKKVDVERELCPDPTVFGSNLYGWVDNTVFSRWDQRACLEPNWDPDYADSHKGQNVSVYADQQMSSGNKVTSWEFGKPNGDNDRWNQYRMAPNQLRFPIIERPSHEKNYAHCIAFITYGSASQDFLERYLGKTAYEKWKKIKCVSMFDGYVKLKDMEGNNIWNYICCFSGDELRYLLYELKELYETAKCNADDRKHYINAMRKVIKYHSIDNNDVYINSMSIKEIKGTIYGLDLPVEIGNSLWSKFTIKDFADPKVVTNIEFRKSLGQFSEKYERLQRIVGDGYKYRILLGNEYYYWIPVEDLP